jgi:hypothetical protein
MGRARAQVQPGVAARHDLRTFSDGARVKPPMIERLRFSRDHRWTPRQLSAYVDGELVAHARVRLDRHLAECSECRGLLHSLKRMLERLERLPPPGDNPTPEQIVVAVRARLHDAII